MKREVIWKKGGKRREKRGRKSEGPGPEFVSQ